MADILSADDVFAVVRATVLEVLPDLAPADIGIDGTLSDLGANSIDRADIVTMAQERLGIVVPVAQFRAVADIRSLVGVLRQNL
jgi:polyketide biosynthesis acyl carrier protein